MDCEDIKMWFPVTYKDKYNRECEVSSDITSLMKTCWYSCECEKYNGAEGCNYFTLYSIKPGSVCDIRVHEYSFDSDIILN